MQTKGKAWKVFHFDLHPAGGGGERTQGLRGVEVSLLAPAVDSGFPQMTAGNDGEKCRLQEEVWSVRIRSIGVHPLPPRSTVLLGREEQPGSRPGGRGGL